MKSPQKPLMHIRNCAVRSTKSIAEHLRPASERHLAYIHIGKCGGETVNDALKASPIVKTRFDRITRTHVTRPFYKPGNRYLFVLRNPISRAISAFNWRYRLVITSDEPDSRFPGEREVLARYETLETLALSLYVNEELQADVAKDVEKIHHLRENIAFYLEHAFTVIGPDQIFAVLCQEYLDDDINTYLGTQPPSRIHDNRSFTPRSNLQLSATARANLARFLQRDYVCIEMLLSLFPVDDQRRDALLAT